MLLWALNVAVVPRQYLKDTCAEHKFPIMIPKKGIRDRGWTLEEARDWMWQHSRVTIVTQEENKRLLPFTEDMEIASKRYEEAGIDVCIHPRYLTKE